jgi:hypothetical protein
MYSLGAESSVLQNCSQIKLKILHVHRFSHLTAKLCLHLAGEFEKIMKEKSLRREEPMESRRVRCLHDASRLTKRQVVLAASRSLTRRCESGLCYTIKTYILQFNINSVPSASSSSHCPL